MPPRRSLVIRPLAPQDRPWVADLFTRHFADSEIESRGVLFDTRILPGLLAMRGAEPVAALAHTPLAPGTECEVVALASAVEGLGAGTALLEHCLAAARAAGCTRVLLTTSNDNTPALRFYQRRGWRMVCVHRDAITRARRRKPAIPLHGHDGILVADEVELEHVLSGGIGAGRREPPP